MKFQSLEEDKNQPADLEMSRRVYQDALMARSPVRCDIGIGLRTPTIPDEQICACKSIIVADTGQ